MQSKPDFSLRDLFALLAVGCIFATLVVSGCDDGVSGDPIKVTPTQVMRFSNVGLLPAVGASRRTARRMQNATQIRGIQMGFVLFSNSNNSFYPGYDTDGRDDFAAMAATRTGWGSGALHKDDISKVYALMLTGEFFTPEYIVSPADTLTPSRSTGKITLTNRGYSYALLDMTAAAPGNRRREWKDTNNSQAPTVSDPSSDIRSEAEGLSTVTYHSDISASEGNSDTDYEGSVAWNDNHVTFENQGQFSHGTLKMGSSFNESQLNPWKGDGTADSAAFIW